MPKLRVLSGKDVVAILERFGFLIQSQQGSHLKLRRMLLDRTKQNLTVPNHRELDRGTLQAIYRQALRFIPESELRVQFYSE